MWNTSHFYISKRDREKETYSEEQLNRFLKAANALGGCYRRGWIPYEIDISKKWFIRHCGERMWKLTLYYIEKDSPLEKGEKNKASFKEILVCANVNCKVIYEE